MIYVYCWLAMAVLFGIVEAQTVGLFSIWFLIGSVVALIFAAIGAPLWLQITVFIVASAVLLILTRPIVKKRLLHTEPTNADMLIGKSGTVKEEIDNRKECGCVKIQGKLWSARSKDGTQIPEGSFVSVLKIEGVKLIVELSE